jgi:hypothetical protein
MTIMQKGGKNKAIATYCQLLPSSQKRLSDIFQADDEGSIPFTRSNFFKGLRDGLPAIPTERLLIIPTLDRRSFAPRATFWSRPPPAASCA